MRLPRIWYIQCLKNPKDWFRNLISKLLRLIKLFLPLKKSSVRMTVFNFLGIPSTTVNILPMSISAFHQLLVLMAYFMVFRRHLISYLCQSRQQPMKRHGPPRSWFLKMSKVSISCSVWKLERRGSLRIMLLILPVNSVQGWNSRKKLDHSHFMGEIHWYYGLFPQINLHRKNMELILAYTLSR